MALDEILDRVALGRLVTVVGPAVSDRLPREVAAVPVTDVPGITLALARPRRSSRPDVMAFIGRGARQFLQPSWNPPRWTARRGRPTPTGASQKRTSLSSMATRVRKTDTERKILDTAGELFHRHGLRGVGVDQIIAESGVAKSTLYAHFRTKDELIAAYLRRTDDSWMHRLQTAADAAGPSPAERIAGVFDALLSSFDRHGFFGCPFVSAAVEAEPGSQAHAATSAHTRRRQEWLTELSHQAGVEDPAALACHLGLLIDGALASGRLLQDRGVVDTAKTAARRALHSHLAPASAPRG
ncbi:TetR/AcrR family transcriptional regulator [Streptomyces sp. NPDC020490]|uniref:TetR/AcrR family transcriptional regulator n=1 Tax=Streptomyces sp. NPDC020490 TaxID=3365078 RepID=UPI0037B9F064